MRIAFFSAKSFERKVFDEHRSSEHEIDYFEARLTAASAPLGRGYPVVCAFVSDQVDRAVIDDLAAHGLKLLALRSAGFNHVDLEACARHQITVVRVPAYSPHAVSEHTLCLLLALNRKIHRAYQRVRELNFSLDGLVGFDIHDKTIGIIGTGKIGRLFATAVTGLGARVLACDPSPSEEVRALRGARYGTLDELMASSDIISLHCPLTPATNHLINAGRIAQMKSGVIILNTGRGQLIDTAALIQGLKTGKIGGAGLDVYEEEEGIFFSDLSQEILHDDTLARLLTFPSVLITAHQGFLTREALRNIAETTLRTISEFARGHVRGEVIVGEEGHVSHSRH